VDSLFLVFQLIKNDVANIKLMRKNYVLSTLGASSAELFETKGTVRSNFATLLLLLAAA
jgi:hypothetical protein